MPVSSDNFFRNEKHTYGIVRGRLKTHEILGPADPAIWALFNREI